MHIGGREAVLSGLAEREVLYSPGNPPVMVNPNGAFEVEQMYVQYVRLATPKARHPLLLMHGGGLCGVTYETKPDGHPGWQSWFLRAGHDVYVADAVERGRASWARSPEIFQGEPHFRTKAHRLNARSAVPCTSKAFLQYRAVRFAPAPRAAAASRGRYRRRA